MRQKAFTLIEILTVMAIIAILASIGMAIYPRAKEGANKSADISQMNSLRNAISLYREDQGGFPPAILGYASLYNDESVVPADQVVGYLVPRRMSLNDVRTASSKHFGLRDIDLATWAPASAAAPGSSPLYDMNGDGTLTADDDPGNARQAWGMMDGCVTRNPQVVDPTCTMENGSAPFYSIGGFDVSKTRYIHPKSDPASPCYTGAAYPAYELRYTLFWTKLGIDANLIPGQGEMDDEHQLGYNNPPDSTIVTWNSGYRQYEPGTDVNCVSIRPTAGSLDWVLTVGGNARHISSRKMFMNSWRGY